MYGKDKKGFHSDNVRNQQELLGTLSQFTEVYKSPMMKELADFVSNPIITEAQERLNRYDEMLKPLHMGVLSKIGEELEGRAGWMKDFDLVEYKRLVDSLPNIASVNLCNVGEAIRVLNDIQEPLKTAIKFSKTKGVEASISGLPSMLQEIGRSSLLSEIVKSHSALSIP